MTRGRGPGGGGSKKRQDVKVKEVKKRQDVKAKKNGAMCWKSCVLGERGATLITGNVVPLASL